MIPLRWIRVSIQWVGKVALCFLAVLLVGCPDGHKWNDHTQHHVSYSPPWALDTTYTVVQIRDRFACSGTFCEQRNKELHRVCNEVVPEDGWIWAGMGDGTQCRCACPQFNTFTRLQLDSVKSAKQLAEAKLLMKRKVQWDERALKSDWKAVHPPKPLKIPADRVTGHIPMLYSDCTQVKMREMKFVPCLGLGWASRSSMALWAMGLYAQADNYPIFNYRIDPASGNDYPGNNGSWEHLDSWSVGDGTVTGGPYEIVFPINFVNSPEVGWELMLFFVGHELGHALGDGVACGYGDIVCEGQCDHWGASIGLRRVCGSGLYCSTYAEIAEAAADQLEAYMARTHADASCGGPMCQVCGYDNAACGYPPALCRATTIRDAYALRPEPDCTRSWITGRSASCPEPRLPGGEPCPSLGPS